MASVSTRRLGTERSETRARLIDAAKQILREEGWAALTARRIGEEVGLTRHIVHYYFGTMDDLLVALIRHEGEQVRERLLASLQVEDPLRVIWELGSHATPLTYEIVGMAMRREAVRAELVRHGQEFRVAIAHALERQLESRGLKPTISPRAITLIVESISQTIAVERALDNDLGHTETLALVESWIGDFSQHGGGAALTLRPKR